MGILFQPRPRSESVEGTNDLQNYGLGNIGINDDAFKVYDDPQVPLDFIRKRIIENTPASKIHFIVDTR